MKRILLFFALATLVAPARAQLFNAPLTPTPAPVALGAGLPSALSQPANSSGGVALLNGPATPGDCLIWGANGIRDAGSSCVTPPTIGTVDLSGTGAPVATSLSNRATDSGVTFSLKNDFGALCNGVTDDTVAIQAWLNKAGPGVHLVAPAGTCNFSAPLTIGPQKLYTVEGAGAPATTFNYVGASPMSAAATASGAWTGGSLNVSTSVWTGGSTSLTLSAAAPAFITTMLGDGAVVSVWDTSSTAFTSPTYVGTVASVNGSTVTLNFGASYGSVGSSDNLLFTADLLTVNPTSAGGIHGITLKGFRITSATPLTGGFALHEVLVWDTHFDDLMLGGVDIGDTGDLCGGYWGDGVSGVHWAPTNITAKQACGDAILLNAAPWFGQIATAEAVIGQGVVGGDWQGGLLSAAHLAGGFGGFRCDATDMGNLARGFIIDNSVVPIGNREIDLGPTCAIDTPSYNGILVDDQYASGGTVDVDGWVASTRAGHGIYVEKWSNGKVEMRGHELYNHCGSGLYVADSSTHVSLSSALDVNQNGSPNLGSTCATWRAANPGHGYGIEASVSTTNITGNPLYSNNAVTGVSGSANFNTNTSLWEQTVNSDAGAGAI